MSPPSAASIISFMACCQARSVCAGITLDGVGPRVSEGAKFAPFRLPVGNGTGESAIPIHDKFSHRQDFKTAINCENALLCELLIAVLAYAMKCMRAPLTPTLCTLLA